MAEHEGPGHGEVTLSLVDKTADGGRTFQSWSICECSAARLRVALGTPQHEAVATAEAVRATGEAVLRQPGSVQLGEGL
jgi:hypothetical protein